MEKLHNDIETKQKQSKMEFFKHPLILLICGAIITYGIGMQIQNTYQTRQAKGYFSLRFVQLSWNQLFWMRNYVTRVKLKLDKNDLDYTWNKYLTSLEAWNTDLMGNLQLFDRYYPKGDKRQIFEENIQPGFIEINNFLIDLRYTKQPPDLNDITKKIDLLNVVLYKFAGDLDVEFSK